LRYQAQANLLFSISQHDPYYTLHTFIYSCRAPHTRTCTHHCAPYCTRIRPRIDLLNLVPAIRAQTPWNWKKRRMGSWVSTEFGDAPVLTVEELDLDLQVLDTELRATLENTTDSEIWRSAHQPSHRSTKTGARGTSSSGVLPSGIRLRRPRRRRILRQRVYIRDNIVPLRFSNMKSRPDLTLFHCLWNCST